jgi:hypothetical protein
VLATSLDSVRRSFHVTSSPFGMNFFFSRDTNPQGPKSVQKPSLGNFQGFPSLPTLQGSCYLDWLTRAARDGGGAPTTEMQAVPHKPMHPVQKAAAFVINKAFLYELGHRLGCQERTSCATTSSKVTILES